MQIWRLVAHHEEPEEALRKMKEIRRIAIGWSSVGDLTDFSPKDSSDIASRLKSIQPDTSSAMMAGPSLWNLFAEVEVGDQVIVTAKRKRECVFEVTGPYIFDTANAIIGYSHQRPAALTDINPDQLWQASGSDVAEGQNIRWTLAKCKGTKKTSDIVHFEGKRFSVTSTAIERDSSARKRCIDYFGCVCQVCGMNFEKVYGVIGKCYIHVHHRVDLAHTDGEHIIDPAKDLIPLCPNCHAMVHTEKPAMTVENLRKIYESNSA